MDLCFNFIGPISDENMFALQNYVDANIHEASSLKIKISSLGGSVFSGITMYNYLKQLPFPITTINVGEVTSAAILLYLAGSVRTALPISKFMIHPIKIGISGEFSYYQIQESLKLLDADICNYAKIVNNETNCLNGKYNIDSHLRSEALTLMPESALECGIITNL